MPLPRVSDLHVMEDVRSLACLLLVSHGPKRQSNWRHVPLACVLDSILMGDMPNEKCISDIK
jgi:hypothetical protein